jgi:uncharacterized membrane protein
MHSLLLVTHSVLRYFVLILLLVVIARSLQRWLSKSSYNKMDDRLSLGLFTATHTQFLIGLILFFVSPVVIFSSASMKDLTARYWLVEHSTAMIIAIVLISVARISVKKMPDASSKHKRMFIFNVIALVIIVVMIAHSQRGFFTISK